MTVWLIMAAVAASQSADTTGWTWSLYGADEGGTVVLANEIPDTPELRATLECEPGSGAVRVSVFGAEDARPDYVSVRSGAASAASQGETAREGGGVRFTAAVRLEHPVFTAFSGTGEMTLAQEDRRWPIRVGRRHLALLSEFAAACDG